MKRQQATFNEAGATMKYGVVSAVNPSACRVRVQFADYDGLESAWLPVMQGKTLKDQHYHLPDVGEQVVAMLDQRGEDGVVLGAIYSSADTPPVSSGDKHHVKFEDGSTVEYDRAAKKLTVVAVGDVSVTSATKITLSAPETVVTGKLTVQGLLAYLAGMTGATGSGQTAVITGDIQVTGDVTAGGKLLDSGGNTNHHSH